MTSAASFHIAALDVAEHRREDFDCGSEPLNRYLHQQARLDVDRRAAGCWVITDASDTTEILGYYTLTAASVFLADLPALPKAARKRLPHYPQLGAWLLGRLAVAASHQGQGLGGRLMIDALRRCLSSEIPAVLVVVDPKDSVAIAFYQKFGFRTLTSTRMFLPLHEVASVLK